jgi:zinc/manganese transport system permease protein
MAGTITARMGTATTAIMLDYDFMRNAFMAAAIVAMVAGPVGYFLVMRGETFAGHALSHVGFAGAAGAILVGIAPLWGLAAFTIAAGIGMGALGERLRQRDVAIGMVLALSLGLGLLFLHFYTAHAAQATALLFGNILAIDAETLWALLTLAAASLAALGIIARPLVFATLQPELAEAKGVSLPLVAVLFMVIVAVAVAESAQIVGVLLVFTLMVGPAAAAQRLTSRLGLGVLLAALIALLQAWAGIALAYATDWPASFWISALGGLCYLAAIAWRRVADAARMGAP